MYFRELLDHIAQLDERVSTLLFTNGVLDSAAKDAQAWLCRAQTAEAKCAQLEAQRGGAVVVPDDAMAWMYAHGNDGSVLVCGEKASGEEFKAKFRAIPADRVLADGMVGVDREELMYLHAFEKYARKHGPESIQDVAGTLDHLRRAQQAKGEVEG